MRLASVKQAVRAIEPREIAGTVRAVKGLVLAVEQLPLPVGSLVRVSVPNRVDWPRGEVVGFEGTRALVMLLAEADGVATGATVIGEQPYSTVGVNEWWLGRVVDALGRPIDGKGDIPPGSPQPMWPPRTSPLTRGVIRDVLPTGVRAIDSMLTIGKGQRMGIFAGPGVGKSTLLGSIARGTTAHVNVIGLIGERGREVPEFLEHVLGEEGLKNSVVVVATGDESPLMRVRAATVACSVAEYFRDQGLDVLLMLETDLLRTDPLLHGRRRHLDPDPGGVESGLHLRHIGSRQGVGHLGAGTKPDGVVDPAGFAQAGHFAPGQPQPQGIAFDPQFHPTPVGPVIRQAPV